MLDGSIYPGLAKAIVQRFSATPLTIERYSGNAEGAITGWSFTNQPIARRTSPAQKYTAPPRHPSRMSWQAGQWTYSPSGLPISILTGKLAADAAVKALGKGK